MNGATAMRGYLLQALVSVLDGLNIDSGWSAVSLEPHITSEKVDILWKYQTQAKVVQVKSSQNQITKSQVEKWAKDLANSVDADEYELLLLGPCSQSVIDLGQVDKVKIPPPRVLDPFGLVEQAAHRLDRYLEGKGISKVPAFARELIVNGLVTKIETYSTQGAMISRADLDKLLSEWVLVLYPRSLNEAVSMQCDLLLDTVVFPAPTGPSHDSLAIILPLVFVNSGVRTAIVEWIALKVVAGDHTKLYTPVAIIDLQKLIQGRRALHAENTLGVFSEFAVPHDGTVTMNVLFTQEENDPRYPFRPWDPGKYFLQIFVKYRNKDSAVKQKEIDMEINERMLAGYRSGESFTNSIRKITSEMVR